MKRIMFLLLQDTVDSQNPFQLYNPLFKRVFLSVNLDTLSLIYQ